MKNQRKKYFVKEGNQWGLLIGAITLILILAIIASGLFYIIANRNLENATYKAHFTALHNTMQLLLPWLILVNLIGLIVVAILAVFYTHKIAGPTYHIMNDLKRLGEGDLTVRTKLRKHDRLQDLADNLNNAIGGIQKSVQDSKMLITELEKSVDNTAEIKKKIENLNKVINRLKT